MTEHSELGASVTARFWNCPGSVLFSRGRPNESSEAALKGTAAHAVGEMCLTTGVDSCEFIDRTIEGQFIDETTASNVQVYLDTCRETFVPDIITFGIEERFTLDRLNPPAPMFGTADFWCLYIRDGRRVLRIVDYKNGWLNVNAHENPQLKYYALGAMWLNSDPVDEIEAIIVQRDIVKRTTFDSIELVEWSQDLMEHARAALEPGAPLVAGPWCKFCPSAGVCPEQARSALALAGSEFDKPWMPPAPATLTPAQLSVVKMQSEMLTNWLKDVDSEITALLNRGTPVPGWKLVATNSPASWKDEDEAACMLEGLYEIDPWQPRKILSPAQARGVISQAAYASAKASKLKLTKKSAESDAKAALAPLVASKSSGLTLVSDADVRPSAITGGAEFSIGTDIK